MEKRQTDFVSKEGQTSLMSWNIKVQEDFTRRLKSNEKN